MEGGTPFMKVLYCLAAFVILVALWTNMLTSPFIMPGAALFIEIYLIAKGATR